MIFTYKHTLVAYICCRTKKFQSIVKKKGFLVIFPFQIYGSYMGKWQIYR